MSTCPSKDLHSVYLDNELPEKYKAEYEAHVQSCPKCQKELESLRNLQKLLRTDADEITPDSHYMEQSFERLQIKMKYRENTQQTKKNTYKTGNANFNKKPNVILYSCIGAAAAAVFALIVPIRISNAKNNASASNTVATAASVLPSVGFGNAATNVSLNSGKTVIISGNIDESVLASQKYGRVGKNVSQNSNSAVEVFRPDFEERNTVYIKITLPGMDTVESKLQ